MSITTQAGDNVTKNRHKYIGGSDIPTILGINKYKTIYELSQEKIGAIKSEFKGNEYTEYGNIMEPQIRDYINMINGTSFTEDTRIHDDLRSNTDGYDEKEHLILEVKTHGKTPAIESYKAQMQLYMYQFECNEGWLALYERPKDFDMEFDSSKLKIKQVPRDNDFIRNMLEAIEDFWKGCAYLKANPGASEHDFNNRTIKGDVEVSEKSTELQVKTIKFEPAVVEFNYKELDAILDENLKKYEGLTFTEDDAAECKKTIIELRKGKKAVDTYRLQTKRKLTESVTDFEKKCKDLNKKFDQVLDPLVEQSDSFETKRKEEKAVEIEGVIKMLVEDEELNEKYAYELIVEDEYLNKGKSMKAINAELKLKAESLGFQQQKFEADSEIIENTVEIANGRYQVNLTAAAYVSLLDHKDVKDIKTQILDDAQDEVEKQVEKEKQAKEIEAIRAEKQKNVAPAAVTSTGSVLKDPDEPNYFEIYEVTGTESQLEALEDFMRSEDILFKIKEGE